MRTPNTTFDIYLGGRTPDEGAPDTAAAGGFFEDHWQRGEQANKGDQTYFWTSMLDVALGVNLPDAYPGAVSDTTLWLPDSAGQAYTVVFVERVRQFRGDDFQRVYLVKELTVAITVKQANGTPTLTNVTTLVVDQPDGFVLSQPGANQAKLNLSLGVGNLPGTPGGGSFNGASVPVWVKATKTYSDLSSALLNNDIEIYSLPAGGVVHAVKVKHSVAFAGTGVTSLTLNVGITGALGKYYLSNFNWTAAVGPTVGQVQANSGAITIESQSAATSIRLAATCNVALNQLTAGSVDVWLLVSKAT
jgi:hypothetical protein